MGIQGLLRTVKDTAEKCNISVFRGKKVGVDGYVWLHRACAACAYELTVGLPTKAYITYFLDRVQLMLDAGVVPVIVFDGDDMPSKRGTNESRQKRREESHAKAKKCLEAGDKPQMAQHYAAAFDITPDLAQTVARVLQNNGVETIIAPYEADGQLAHLAHTGQVSAVVSEDSDLLAHGVHKVFTKMDYVGDGELYTLPAVVSCALRLDAAESPAAHAAHFLTFCILCGCDYLPNLRGVGPRKAADLARHHPDIEGVAKTLLASGAASASELAEYCKGFKKARYTFLYQRVLDPRSGVLAHARPMAPAGGGASSGAEEGGGEGSGGGGGGGALVRYVEEECGGADALIGPRWGDEVVRGVAALTVDPSTLRPYEGRYDQNVDPRMRLRSRTRATTRQTSLFDFMKPPSKKQQAAVPAAPAKKEVATPVKKPPLNPFARVAGSARGAAGASSPAPAADRAKQTRSPPPPRPPSAGAVEVEAVEAVVEGEVEEEAVDEDEGACQGRSVPVYVSAHFYAVADCYDPSPAAQAAAAAAGSGPSFRVTQRDAVGEGLVEQRAGPSIPVSDVLVFATTAGGGGKKRRREDGGGRAERLERRATLERLRHLEANCPEDGSSSVAAEELGEGCTEASSEDDDDDDGDSCMGSAADGGESCGGGGDDAGDECAEEGGGGAVEGEEEGGEDGGDEEEEVVVEEVVEPPPKPSVRNPFARFMQQKQS